MPYRIITFDGRCCITTRSWRLNWTTCRWRPKINHSEWKTKARDSWFVKYWLHLPRLVERRRLRRLKDDKQKASIASFNFLFYFVAIHSNCGAGRRSLVISGTVRVSRRSFKKSERFVRHKNDFDATIQTRRQTASDQTIFFGRFSALSPARDQIVRLCRRFEKEHKASGNRHGVAEKDPLPHIFSYVA